MRRVGVALTVLVTVAGGWCACAAARPIPEPILRIVLDNPYATPAADTQLSHAEWIEESRCMAAQGFTMPAWSPPPAFAPSASLLSGAMLPSVPSESQELRLAAQTAYGIALRRSTTVVLPPGPDFPPPSDVAFWSALMGPPDAPRATFTVQGIAKHTYGTQGCLATAAAELFGTVLDAEEATYYPEDIQFAVLHFWLRDPGVKAAARRWSLCFQRATGHRVSTPGGVVAGALVREVDGKGPVSAGERRYEKHVALATIRCEYSTGYVTVGVARARRLASHWAAPFVPTLSHLISRDEAAFAAVRGLLAGAGS